MSQTVTTGFTAPANTRATTYPDLIWATNYRVKSSVPNKAELVNVSADSSNMQPEVFTFGYSEVLDIYKNSGIDLASRGPSARGFSLLVKNSMRYKVTDSVTGGTYYLPFSVHTVIKGPSDANITPALVLAQVQRTLAALYEGATNETLRLGALSRGILIPTGL